MLSTTAPRAIADAYLATWNTHDDEALTTLLERHWSSDVAYVDPLARAEGHEAVRALVAGAHEQFPGCEFSLVGDVDAHHDQARFRWGLGPAGEEPLVIGFDVVLLGEDGRIRDVRGFLDVVPG